MARDASRDLSSPSGQSARRDRSKRRAIIVGLVLLQIAAAGFLLVNRTNSGAEPDSEAATTAEAALREGAKAQTEGRADEAERAFLRALELDPNNKIARYNLGVLEESKGPGNKAEEYYMRALAIDPNFVPALFNLAVRRDAAGQPQEAADLYRKIIELDPAMAKAHLNLGFVLLRKLNQKEEGRRELLKAIILDESLSSRVSKEDLQS